MSATVDQHDVVERLAGVALLRRCTEYERTLIAKRVTIRTAPAGETIVRAGEDGSSMMMLLEGSAEVVVDGAVTRRFAAGEYFGELAALLPAPRATDVVAATDCVLAVLETNALYLVVDTIPGVARKLLEGLAAQMRTQLADA
jgi:CRP-like cAMP-binding protein